MFVIKRNGNQEPVHFDKITSRISILCDMDPSLDKTWVDPIKISQKVIQGVYPGVKTTELDILAAETAAALNSQHPDYGKLASRIEVSNLHKNTPKTFSEAMFQLYNFYNKKINKNSPLISEETWNIVNKYKKELDESIINSNDYTYDYFGFKTLERSYLLKVEGKIVERPQYMLMRVSIGIHGDNIKKIIKSYIMMSNKDFTHATPTLFNAGTPRPQMSSCFLCVIKDDSIQGIYDTIKDCAIISKYAGGIGISIHNIRASGSFIEGTNGISNGIVPMLQVFNHTARYVDQCFTGDTKIDVLFGVCEIQKLKIGDQVRTHNNNFKEITKVLEYPNKTEKLLQISVGERSVSVTSQHPFYAISNCYNYNAEELVNSLKKGVSFIDWIEAENLNIGDYLVHLRFSDKFIKDEEIIYGKYILNRITDITRQEETTQTLYDLEVEDDHSYVTSIGLVHNGGGKRKGSFAIYIEPWHADILDFLNLRKNTGKEEMRARDLFLALWIPDLFMERVEKDLNWTLMCPHECPGLSDCYGEEFNKLYEGYEKENKGRKTIKARTVWNSILENQIETGNPYMLYKDACNKKSNQNNLGTIKSSNLCTEILEYTSPEEIAVCNLASIALPNCISYSINSEGISVPYFDVDKLYDITCQVTYNLNKIIDRNYYPLPEAKKSNLRHRPIGIGVQGLADVFIMLGYPFESIEAQALNREIFEVIYFAALSKSNRLAHKYGTYKSYKGSLIDREILQQDLWGVKDSPCLDWKNLRKNIKDHGVRNSLLVAPMPTASTSQILGWNECFEPYTSNIYTRRTLSGEFTIVNKHLVYDLIKLKMWTPEMKNRIIANGGSIQAIESIPANIREIYKTVWEVKQRNLINMAADRGAFIDQSQSFNVFMESPTINKLTSMHFYGWKKGLKTGMYYLRTRPAANAIQFTVDEEMLKESNKKEAEEFCTMKEGCISCSG